MCKAEKITFINYSFPFEWAASSFLHQIMYFFKRIIFKDMLQPDLDYKTTYLFNQHLLLEGNLNQSHLFLTMHHNPCFTFSTFYPFLIFQNLISCLCIWTALDEMGWLGHSLMGWCDVISSKNNMDLILICCSNVYVLGSCNIIPIK